MASNIYVLQVGINQYPRSVSNLHGCRNDVHHVRDYLESTFNADHLKQEVLLDEQATRENVVSAFRNHLSQATSDDVVLFQYSGHGARCKSAPEFEKYFPGGWDEGLVLHDSRTPGKYDLADKELAILLAEVGRNQPHIAVLLDCCHSGSSTRETADLTHLQVRQTYTIGDARPLPTYLNGYYSEQIESRNKLAVPTSQHILLAACERKQKAWESRDLQGVFTSTFLKVLRNSNSDLSYANLFLKCRAEVRRVASSQEPQFETYGGFRAYSGFLGQEAEAAARRCIVAFSSETNRWEVDRGAMHGLPTSPGKQTTMDIYPSSERADRLGIAATVSVGAQKSEIELSGYRFDSNQVYEAELTSMPAAKMAVAFTPEDNVGGDVSEMLTKHDGELREFQLFSDDKCAAKYALHVNGEEWRVELEETGALIVGARGGPDESSEYIFGVLNQIARWERIADLQNDHTKLNTQDVDFQLVRVTAEGQEIAIEHSDFTFDVERANEGFRGKIVSSNRSNQELHLALVGLGQDFTVQAPVNIAVDPKTNQFEFTFPDRDTGVETPLFWAHLDEGAEESIHVLKLLISTERLDEFQIVETQGVDLGAIREFATTKSTSRSLSFGGAPRKKIPYTSEWFTKSITIRVKLQNAQVSTTQDTTIAGGHITIKANPVLKASIGMSAGKTAGRSIGESTDFYRALEDSGAELVNFSSTRGDDSSVLELSEIQVDEHNLQEHPLEVEIDVPLGDNEYILPVAFDGSNILLVGEPTKDEHGRTQVSIDHLPDISNNRKSVFKALKLYFFKCIGISNPNLLRWVDYSNGNVVRKSVGVSNQVAGAQRVLVLVHGIIGDTQSIAEGLRLVSVDGDPLTAKFDVVLTYDYENLSTPIEETARIFKEQLAAIGLAAGTNKHVTFLVHSMGGLVSRWFIEREGGDQVVDHLVMCGTPNGGSPFGHAGDVRKAASILSTIALSTFPPLVPYLGPLLYAVTRSAKVTPTLEQMHPKSQFLKDLAASPDPKIPYSILAGDVRDYDESEDSFTARLVANAGQGFLLSKLFQSQGHDIAVSVDSIRNTPGQRQPAARLHSIICHHLNYFVADASLAVLATLKW